MEKHWIINTNLAINLWLSLIWVVLQIILPWKNIIILKPLVVLEYELVWQLCMKVLMLLLNYWCNVLHLIIILLIQSNLLLLANSNTLLVLNLSKLRHMLFVLVFHVVYLADMIVSWVVKPIQLFFIKFFLFLFYHLIIQLSFILSHIGLSKNMRRHTPYFI